MGQNEYADEIARQMKQVDIFDFNSINKKTHLFQSGSTSAADAAQTTAMMMSGTNSWAAYAQQWAGASQSNPTNGSNSSSIPSS